MRDKGRGYWPISECSHIIMESCQMDIEQTRLTPVNTGFDYSFLNNLPKTVKFKAKIKYEEKKKRKGVSIVV